MRKSLLIPVVSLLTVLIAAAPVAASALSFTGDPFVGDGGALPTAARQPDGRVRLLKIAYELFPPEAYSRPWAGSNIYNTTGTGQRAREFWYDSTPGWKRWVFGVSIQNDGTTSDRIQVKATGSAVAGFTVKYFRGTTDITSAVKAGTFTTPSLAPGGKYLIKVKVTHAADVYDFADLKRLVSLTSVGNPNKMDAVKVVVKHQVCTC